MISTQIQAALDAVNAIPAAVAAKLAQPGTLSADDVAALAQIVTVANGVVATLMAPTT